MKKILVVDDTAENLEAAQSFFSKVAGFEFIYATNRKNAEEYLNKVDAVITDRSIPLEEGGSNYNDESYKQKEMYINGNYICLKSFSLGKPVVLVSHHGDRALLGIVRKVGDDVNLGDIPRVLKQHEETHKEMLKVLNESNVPARDLSQNESIRNGTRINDYIGINFLPSGMSKKDFTAWKAAWEELLKQF